MNEPIKVKPKSTDPRQQIHRTYSPTGLFIPTSIEEAIAELEKMLHPQFIAEARAMSQSEFLDSQHCGLAMWIRNNWELWRVNRLSQSLQGLGITHPDSMSSFLLGQFWDHLQQPSTAE